MRKFFVRISMVAFMMVALASCVDDSAEILPDETVIMENGQADGCKDGECG